MRDVDGQGESSAGDVFSRILRGADARGCSDSGRYARVGGRRASAILRCNVRS